jgi:hypothetical protein
MSKVQHEATLGLLLASALVLSIVTAVHLVASSNLAYAQDTRNERITNLHCAVRDDGTQVINWQASGLNPDLHYSFGVFDSNDQFLVSSGNRGAEMILFFESGNFAGYHPIGGVTLGEEYTVHLSDDTHLDLVLLDEASITCSAPEEEPDLTEIFPNQGQCIAEANTNPNSGITKEDCKAAFKA